jgi:hypothetical protein
MSDKESSPVTLAAVFADCAAVMIVSVGCRILAMLALDFGAKLPKQLRCSASTDTSNELQKSCSLLASPETVFRKTFCFQL